MTLARVAVIGAGTMGSQIAQQAALHGFEVRLHDAEPLQLERAVARNRELLQRRVAKGELDPAQAEGALARVRPEIGFEAATGDADLAIEAVVEEITAKRAVFDRLETHAPAQAVLATNSSTMVISEIAGHLATRHRCLALHFFNPALAMRLVEIAPAPFTDPDTVELAVNFVARIDREPVVLDREVPGLLVNRILWALRREALWLADNGYAAPRAIDRAVKLGLNHPMGPFELADFNGLDVVLAAQRHRFAASGDTADRPSALLERLVEAGRLGRKSGAGFYDYDESGHAKP